MRKQKGLWAKRVFVICLTLLCVLSAVYDAATANATMINNALGVQTFRVVESRANAGFDANYFPADYDSPEKLFEAAALLCRQAEAEGLVLLTNENNALPLPAGAKISFFAQGAVNPNFGSTGSSAASTDVCVSFRDAFEQEGFSVNAGLWDWYVGKAKGYDCRMGRNYNISY